MSSELEILQNDIAARLAADTFFADVPIFAIRSKATDSIINAALSGINRQNNKAGAAIQVLIPIADGETPEVPGPRLQLTITIRVQEIPEINLGTFGTLISAEDLAVRVLKDLHHYYTGRQIGPLYAAGDALTPSLDFPPRLTYDIQLTSHYQITQGAAVVIPTITQAAGSITITTATSAASIYYTADDKTFPSAAEGATLYSAPFAAPAAGTVIRAAAYKTALRASDVRQYTVTA